MEKGKKHKYVNIGGTTSCSTFDMNYFIILSGSNLVICDAETGDQKFSIAVDKSDSLCKKIVVSNDKKYIVYSINGKVMILERVWF